MDTKPNNRELENCFVQYIINLVGPTEAIEQELRSKYDQIYDLLQKFFESTKLNFKIINFGSFPSKIYHTNSDLDVTVVLLDQTGTKVRQDLTYEELEQFLSKKVVRQFGFLPERLQNKQTTRTSPK